MFSSANRIVASTVISLLSAVTIFMLDASDGSAPTIVSLIETTASLINTAWTALGF